MSTRNKAKQNEDVLKAAIGLPSISSFLLVLYFTKSLSFAVTVGMIVGAFAVVCLILYHFKKIDRLKRSGIYEIDQLSGRQFEMYLKYLFQAHGYRAKVTRESGDFGADLVLQDANHKIVVQAKRYKKNVGLKAVQEVYSSIKKYKATEGWVVTNSYFTEQAKELAEANEVRLIHRDELISMSLRLNSENKPDIKRISEQSSKDAEASPVCHQCGSGMIVRKGPSGKFYGCSRFPKCRNTMQIAE